MTAKWPVDLTKRFERFVTTALSIVNRVDKLCNRQIPIIYIYIFGNSFNCNCNVLLIHSHYRIFLPTRTYENSESSVAWREVNAA